MKKGLCALFASRINFWKLLIQQNQILLNHLQQLLKCQLVCQKHFGNQLIRDQINFMVEALSSIDKANDIFKKCMIKKNPNCMQKAIIKLIAFKTIQHMRNYKRQIIKYSNEIKSKNILIYSTYFNNQNQNQKLVCVSQKFYTSKLNQRLKNSTSTSQNSGKLFNIQIYYIDGKIQKSNRLL